MAFLTDLIEKGRQSNTDAWATLSDSTSKRLVTFERNPIPGASLRKVVPHCDMLHATVVPESDRVFLPSETRLKLRLVAMLKEQLKDCVAFACR